MRHIDLFSGIGGFALAVDTVWPNSEHIFCDNDPFCQQVLKKHWPSSQIYGDIRTLASNPTSQRCVTGSSDGKERQILYDQNGISKENKPEREGWERGSPPFTGVGILTGGFPCQPFSQAGRRQGTADNRYLWPEMFRVIREFKPTWVIAENVRGLLTISEGLVLEQVCADLESEGYEVQPLIIPACSVNAPHRRDRIWFIANRRRGYGSEGDSKRLEARETVRGTSSVDSERPNQDVTNTERQGHERQEHQAGQSTRYNRGSQFTSWSANWPEVATELCGVDDGLPAELDGFKLTKAGHRNNRLKALGNAIVPQVAIEIMKAIKYSQFNN